MSQPVIDYGQVQEWMARLLPARAPEFLVMEEHAALHDFPIIGPICGNFCYLIARLTGAQRIFELGSGYGYSSAWLAWAVRENGGMPPDAVVHHTVWDEELSQQARRHLGALGYGDLVRFHVGEAVAALEADEGDPYDLILMDITKRLFPGALPAIRRKLRPGGVLIADNMLRDGRTLDAEARDADTEGVRTLLRTLLEDAAWSLTVVPQRDGLLVARLAG